MQHLQLPLHRPQQPRPTRTSRCLSGSRAPALGLALCLTLTLTGCGGDGASAPSRPPDVVLVVIDTLRADRLSAYGYERATSPFLDARAAEGVLFEDVTSQSSWTLPSMVSMFSGRYLTAYRDVLQPDAQTLPETFRAAGYRTLGLAANVLLTEDAGFGRGFDHYDPAPAPGEPGGPVRARTLEQLSSDLWAPLEEALREDANGSRPPLFLYLHPFDPHDPYFAHPEYNAELPPLHAAPLAPEGWHAEEFLRRGPPSVQGEVANADDTPDAPGADNWSDEAQLERAFLELQHQRGLYDQEVRHTDHQLELVFARLAELGLLEHAVVAVVSDHGEGLWDHVANRPEPKLREAAPTDFFYQKHGGHLYEEAIATPFLLWGAGVPRGVRVASPVENVDLYPTLLELSGITPPAGLQGRSLVSLTRGGTKDPRYAVFSHILYGVTVRELETNLKLIAPFDPANRNPRPPELFDLGADPLEHTSLWSPDSEDAARLQTMIDIWTVRHPTESSDDIPIDAAQAQRLRDLGYTGEHTGR